MLEQKNWDEVKGNYYALCACILNKKLAIETALSKFDIKTTTKDFYLKKEEQAEEKFEIEFI